MKSSALSRTHSKTQLLVNAGLMIAISMVLKLIFELYIPLGGLPSLRINLTSIPIMFSGIVFGPLVGFIVGFLSDLLCFFIKPSGPYFLGFTIASGFVGLIPGFLWIILKKHPVKYLNWINLIFVLLFTCFMLYTNLFSYENFILSFSGKPIHPLILLLMICILIGYVIFPFFSQRYIHNSGSALYLNNLFFMVNVSQLITSVFLNTIFLTALYGQAIMVLLPGRLISNLFLVPLYTSLLISVLNVIPKDLKMRILYDDKDGSVL